MALTLITKPTAEPVSVEMAKSHLRVTHNADDAYIEQLCKAVRTWTEGYLHRALITQTWDWKLDHGFPCSPFKVPLPPLQSITSIKYIDIDGVEQTVTSSVYDVDIASEPGRIALAWGQSWPSVREQMNNVTIRMVCGYGDVVDVPKEIVHAMKILLSHLYEHREPVIVGAAIANVPHSIESLLWPNRVDIL